MARAALDWSRADLAQAAGLGVATVVRFETGRNVEAHSVFAMRTALEKRRIQFVSDGPLKGAVYRGLRPAR